MDPQRPATVSGHPQSKLPKKQDREEGGHVYYNMDYRYVFDKNKITINFYIVAIPRYSYLILRSTQKGFEYLVQIALTRRIQRNFVTKLCVSRHAGNIAF